MSYVIELLSGHCYKTSTSPTLASLAKVLLLPINDHICSELFGQLQASRDNVCSYAEIIGHIAVDMATQSLPATQWGKMHSAKLTLW